MYPDTNILIEALLEHQKQKDKTIEFLAAKIVSSEAELTGSKNKKNSNNSHIPPSQDQNRPKKNQSFRVKTGIKPGGQIGHQGKTLEFKTTFIKPMILPDATASNTFQVSSCLPACYIPDIGIISAFNILLGP